MLDIHMIATTGWEDNFEVQKKIMESNPRVTVHREDFIPNHVLYARINGYAKGTSKYVSYFDDDDYIIDFDWVDEAIEMMERNPRIAIVYPRYNAVHAGKVIHTTPTGPYRQNRSFPPIHSLSIMRREQIEQASKMFTEGLKPLNPQVTNRLDNLMHNSLKKFGMFANIPNIAYNWNLREGTARNTPLELHVERWALNFC